MANVTHIPAFRAQVGDWTYYIGTMTYAAVKNQINFAYEKLGKNRELEMLLQRGITSRTEVISEYLQTNGQRFLGALTVGVWGGNPDFQEVGMADRSGLMAGIDDDWGLLVLNGDETYFAIDGQHRLQAIKDAVARKPELGSEKIAVLFVPHYDTAEGRERTRRLFTSINRKAQRTTKAENIALDEDDGIAIVTRRLLDEHDLLGRDGVVRIFSRPPAADGRFTLAGAAIPRTDPRAWTNMGTLYEMLRPRDPSTGPGRRRPTALGFGLHPSMCARPEDALRPSGPVLDESYATLSRRLDDLLDACGGLRGALADAAAHGTARALRAPEDGEERGHALMRPIVQRHLAQTLGFLVGDQQRLTWDEALARLRGLDWELGQPPWTAVFNEGTKRMLTGRDNTTLLRLMLEAHLAPASKRQIADARREYKDLIGADYPVSADALAARLTERAMTEHNGGGGGSAA